jgi:phenylpyruvate tautomerase PptA (4-oxalocrotonate tautomerase family)
MIPMPHVIVELWPSKSEPKKTELAEQIRDSVISVLPYAAESVSVAFEEVRSTDWAEKVYRLDIEAKWSELCVKPEVPEPRIEKQTDAIIRITAACVCGSDLWGYRGINPVKSPTPMGHEYCGVVEELGSAVRNVKPVN